MLSSNRQGEKQTLMHLVHSGMSLRQLSRKERVVLGAICLCTLALLAALQHGRVFLGDEIGTLRYLKESPSYILTHFATWLSMNYFILVEKGVAWLCGAADWRLTLLPMAAAVAIIPLTASLALKFTGSTRTALIAASLAAFNHYLVLWGPAIRAYSLLVALSLLAINEFFHWYQQRDWWSGVRCAAVVLLLLLAHLNGVYTVAFLILLLMAESVSAGFSGGRRFLWDSRTLWIPLGGVAIIVGIAYWRLLPDIAKVNKEWGTDTPPTSMAIYSTSLYYVYGCWLRGLVVLAVTARRLLVGGKREASATSAVGSDHSGPYPYVFAGGLCSIMGLRPLSNFFSSLALDLNSGGHRLARNTRLDGERRRCRSLGSDGNSCFRLDALGSRAVSRQGRMAVCPGGHVSAHADAEKRRDRRGTEHWVFTLAILRHTLKIALCYQTNMLAKLLAISIALYRGAFFT